MCRAKTSTNGATGARQPKSMVVPARSKTTRRISGAVFGTDRLQIVTKVLQVRRLQTWDLRLLIPAPESNGVVGMLAAEKRLHFFRREWTALQAQTSLRCVRQLRQIFSFRSTQITLGRHVQ